ncbi:hypothetical protein ACVJBD_006403 [Rhizobium mongolense]
MKADELKRLARALRWDYRVVALARDLAIASALASAATTLSRRVSPHSEPKLIVADGPVSVVDTSLRMSIVNLFRGVRNWAFMRRRRVLILPAQNRHARTVTKPTVRPKYSDIFIDPELRCYSHSAMSENPI